MKKYLTVIFSFIFLFGCSETKKEKPELNQLKENLTVQVDTSMQVDPKCLPKDTLLPDGAFIRYTQVKEEFRIIWGNEHLERKTPKTYACNLDEYSQVWDDIPHFDFMTKSHIGLRQIYTTSGGANPAPMEYLAVLLPLNKLDTIVEIENYLEANNNYIISSDVVSTIYIYNIQTNKKQTINLQPLPVSSRTISNAIEKMEIKNKKFYIKYNGFDPMTDKDLIVSKIYSISI